MILAFSSSVRTKGVVIFRVPTGNEEWSNNWQKLYYSEFVVFL